MGRRLSVPTGCIDVKSSAFKGANSFNIKNYVYYPDKSYCYNICLANVFYHIKKIISEKLFKIKIEVYPCNVFVRELNEKEKIDK